MTRRYCGRVGAAFDVPDGERCPECTSTTHLPIDTCGHFVACTLDCQGDNDHDGHPCLREHAYSRERIARSQAEVSLARLLDAVASLIEETGEYDDDGAFVPVPRASLSGQSRDDITARHEYRAAWERASRALAIGAVLSPEMVLRGRDSASAPQDAQLYEGTHHETCPQGILAGPDCPLRGRPR